MCAGNGNGDSSNTIERETQVDSFTHTRNVGETSGAGHSGLSMGEAPSIAMNPASKLSTREEKGLAAAQVAIPGGFILGGLRALSLRSRSRSLLGASDSGKTLLGG